MTADQLNLTGGEHAVHFYRADAELTDLGANYLDGALGSGGVAIAIATGAHLRGIRHKLVALGVDIQRALEDGRLILLDAETTLGKLISGGQVDRAAFGRVVGSVIRSAGRRGSAVRAYGEMVDLLWQAGDIAGAIELERLWNELMARTRFALLCAYQSEAVAAPGHDHALRAVCQLHSAVSSASGADPFAVSGLSREVAAEFEPEANAPRAARRFVEDVLRDWGHDGLAVNDARLLVSELVTNAVLHTRSPFSVSVASGPSKLRLAVHDRTTALPMPGERPSDARTGRGLRIVAAVADDWGVATTSDGKTVWADLSPH